MYNKSCTYITFKSAVKHRQLGDGYPNYLCHATAVGQNVVRILSEDSDLFVLLVYKI